MSDPPGAGTGQDPKPAFGPSGYLPERAAKRARKIVLRAPLGIQWIVGAFIAGLLVLVAGVSYLQGGDAPPPEPWVAVGPVEEFGPSRFDAELEALIVTASGRVRAFAGAEGVAYCAASNRLEADEGRVWTLTGRGLNGEASLDEHPTLLSAGVLYVDPSRRSPAPPSSEDPAEPAC